MKTSLRHIAQKPVLSRDCKVSEKCVKVTLRDYTLTFYHNHILSKGDISDQQCPRAMKVAEFSSASHYRSAIYIDDLDQSRQAKRMV